MSKKREILCAEADAELQKAKNQIEKIILG